MTSLIVLTGDLSSDDLSAAAAAAAPHDVIVVAGVDDVGSDLARAKAIIGHVEPRHLRAAPDLQWVHSWIAGPDSQLHDAMIESNVVLTSSAGNGGVPLAEHALMLMLMLDRGAVQWVQAQERRRWERHVHGELWGRTVAIIGLGHAGADLARKAKAFGMRTLGMRRRPGNVEGVDRIYSHDSLHEMLAESDFVVVTTPRTPQTLGMLGSEEFAAMRPSSFYICISRGGVADDDALLRALRTGSIAGAGLDAHAEEPLRQDSPFWDLPNVIVTPHNGATTPSTARRGVQIMLENLRRFSAGEKLLNVVDKRHGY